ncbi:hypothetical protein AB0H73_06385 [Streptomyces olivoreticuli]
MTDDREMAADAFQQAQTARSTASLTPGKAPTVVAVVRFLKAAGFQTSLSSESMSRGASTGAYVRRLDTDGVSVNWNEGDGHFFQRMAQLGVTSAADMPKDPQAAARAQDYAEALAPRYNVKVSDTWLFVRARKELPIRPPGIPKAMTVRKALVAAKVIRNVGQSREVSVVDQPDHTRVAVADDVTLATVTAALDAEGWTFEQSETIEHFAIKITGSAPDRPARLRKLRASRTAAPTPATSEHPRESTPPPTTGETPDAPEEQPVPSSTEEPPEFRRGDRVRSRRTDGGMGTVTGRGFQDGHIGVDIGGAQIFTPPAAWELVERAPEEPEAAEAQAAPVQAAPEVPLDQDESVQMYYAPAGKTAYTPGMRITWRSLGLSWHHGTIQEIFLAAHTREPHVRFLEDSYEAAPPSKKNQFGIPYKRKVRRHAEPKTVTVPLNNRISPEK